MKSKQLLLLGAALCGLFTAVNPLHAQGTAFTYQGRLDDGGLPASGIYDLQFAIYDSAVSGAQIGNAITNSPVSVSNGLFTVTLDFGNGVFNGNALWLEIGVRTSGSPDDFTTLSPRQPLTPSPYALYAPNAGSAVGVTEPVAASQRASPVKTPGPKSSVTVNRPLLTPTGLLVIGPASGPPPLAES